MNRPLFTKYHRFGGLEPLEFLDFNWDPSARNRTGSWRYPPDNGFLPGESPQNISLPLNTVIDRYGSPRGESDQSPHPPCLGHSLSIAPIKGIIWLNFNRRICGPGRHALRSPCDPSRLHQPRSILSIHGDPSVQRDEWNDCACLQSIRAWNTVPVAAGHEFRVPGRRGIPEQWYRLIPPVGSAGKWSRGCGAGCVLIFDHIVSQY